MVQPSRAQGLSPSTVAIVVIGLVVVLAGGLMLLFNTQQAATDPPSAPAEEANPFEGLPPEERPDR